MIFLQYSIKIIMRRSLPQLRLEDTDGHQHVIQDQEDSGMAVKMVPITVLYQGGLGKGIYHR